MGPGGALGTDGGAALDDVVQATRVVQCSPTGCVWTVTLLFFFTQLLPYRSCGGMFFGDGGEREGVHLEDLKSNLKSHKSSRATSFISCGCCLGGGGLGGEEGVLLGPSRAFWWQSGAGLVGVWFGVWECSF